MPHYFNSNLNNLPSSFWCNHIKSKHPYKWSSHYKDSFPWFGFVGYEIHYSGDLRVRKSSLKKEKKKQKEVVTQIIDAIRKGKRKDNATIYESAVNRLIGMSVGRINIKNCSIIDNEMCWVKGFTKLNDNKHLRAQLKDLDRYRAKQLSNLLKSIKEIETIKLKPVRKKINKFTFTRINGFSGKDSEEIRNQLVLSGILNKKFRLNKTINLEKDDFNLGLTNEYHEYNNVILSILQEPIDNKKPKYYGKPFSYYYQTIERSKNIIANN